MRPEAPDPSGRCYCGACNVVVTGAPLTVVHCHCSDCRRITGAAIATFAAFPDNAVRIEPDLREISHTTGVHRRFCPDCGSPLTARFDYLPGQIFVPLGVLSEAETLVPERHCHSEAMLSWLKIGDGLPREAGSGRDSLRTAGQ